MYIHIFTPSFSPQIPEAAPQLAAACAISALHDLQNASAAVRRQKVTSLEYMLNRYSRIPVAQPQEYEYRIPPGSPCI